MDWIDAFLEYSSGINSPDIFRLWSGIATVAGALERRTYVLTGKGEIYPNLYTLLIAPPGIGKTRAINYVSDLWLRAKVLRVAPDSVTKASLVDALADASRKIILSPTEIMEFNALLASAPEFGVLLPSHDLEFLNTLNAIYDCPRFYRETRRYMKNDPIEIIKPQLNIIGGTQPAYLANLLPEDAWGMGFMSRVIMIYSREEIYVPLFENNEHDRKTSDELAIDLRTITKLHGRFSWSEEAQTEMERWVKAKCPPRPEHSKLEYYTTRRPVHVLKLCQVASAARSNDLEITLADLERARTWLTEAEYHMPDIFKDMIYRSDAQVLQELHYFVWRIYAKEKKDVHESRLIHFLRTKVPSEKIDKILDIADRANIITRIAGPQRLWRPRPKGEHGEE